jgi:uracil-DNA glycosylase family 4
MDSPKSLKDEKEKRNRLELRYESNVLILNKYVEEIRSIKNVQDEIPYFDPLDGGVNAKYLFLLEAPGKKATQSGFVSRNNPDETAKNIFELLNEVGLKRKETVLWNIVPWYIGKEGKIRPATEIDIKEGWTFLEILLEKLPKLKTIILVGRKAQKIERKLYDYKKYRILECFHPSPMYINRKINNRDIIREQLKKIVVEKG